MNLDDWKYHSSKLPTQNTVEWAKYCEDLINEFTDEIKNNPDKYDDFFDGCYPSCIDTFITFYVSTKLSLITSANYYLEQTKENREFKYQDEANEIFDLILQKKLFDLQIQWRAETLEIPQVRLCADFIFWEQRIRDCPFLELVTDAEVRVMESFLKSNNFSDQTQSWLCYWQDGGEILEKDEDGLMEMYPEWYEFYDGRMGTGALLSLPDIRGAKENAYMQILRDKVAKERELKPSSPIQQMTMLNPDHKTIHEFIHTYEDKYFMAIADGYLNTFAKTDEAIDAFEDELDTAYYLLQEADEPVYMPGGMPWKEAIVKCAQQYKNGKIANELDMIFEEYMMFKDAGIGWELADYSEEYRKDGLCKQMEDNMIKARVLNGEPADLNF